MSQTFQEILLDYGVWVAETTSTTQTPTATCKTPAERAGLLPPLSFEPSRLNKSNSDKSRHHNLGKELTGPLHTFSPTQPVNCSNSYGSPGWSSITDSPNNASEDETASQAPSLTFSSSTLSPGRSITSPTTPSTALQLSHRPSDRKPGSRSKSPHKDHADNKSKSLNISFPIQQNCLTDGSTVGYHSIQVAIDEASYKPKRPAPTPPTSIDFTMQVTPPSETSFMDWDESSGMLQLRNTLRRTGTKKQNSSHRHIVRHQASTESFSHTYVERGRPSRRVDHMHTTSEEFNHDYPHKLTAAKSLDNLLRVPDLSRREPARLIKRPGSATKSPARSDKSIYEVKLVREGTEAESGPGKFRGLVKTLITKLSNTSLRSRAHESLQDNDDHKLRSCSSTLTLRQRHMMG